MAKKRNTNTTTSNKRKQKASRGVFLSIWLGLMIVVNLVTFALIMDRVKSSQVLFPYMLSLLLLITVAKIVATVGIWVWERWALYVYAGAVVGTIIIGLVLTGTWLFAFNEILPLAILGWLLRDKYANFN